MNEATSQINDLTPLIDGSKREEIPSGKPCVPYRYCLVLLLFFGFFHAMATRVCLNIAIVAMVNFTAPETNTTSDECTHIPDPMTNSTQHSDSEFNWDGTTQSILLASFFYGYIFTQLPGGYLAERIGAKYVFGAAVFIPSILSILTPFVARWSVHMLIALRIVMGVAEGPIFPACFAMLGVWAPPYERTQMSALSVLGAQVGTVCSVCLTGYLCTLSFLGGWPTSFYLFGVLGIIWTLLWIVFAQSSPEEHSGLSSYERNYILSSLASAGKRRESQKRPWMSILFSKATLAVYGTSLFDGIGFNAFASSFAIYLRRILKFDMSQNGMISSVPYIFQGMSTVLSGILADWLRRHHISTTTARKLFTFMGEGLLACCCVGIGLVDCNRMAAVSLYFIAQAAAGINGAGFFANPIDLAPIFAGTVFGIANLFANVGGFLSPMLIGLVTDESSNKQEWSWVFFGMSGCYFMGIVIFLSMGSGEEQPWAKDSSGESNMEYTVQAQDSIYASSSDNGNDNMGSNQS